MSDVAPSAADTFVALVHHPVYDKHRQVVSTALTNLDLHDIARSSRTYGLGGFFIVHPVAAQRALASRIAEHWMTEGAELNDFRRQAIERITVVGELEEARRQVTERSGVAPTLVATAARKVNDVVGYQYVRDLAGPKLLVLGTGWGLTDELIASSDLRLRAVSGRTDYNHLSVRSACAIILDRLYGDRED
jgi:hypothetical protein